MTRQLTTVALWAIIVAASGCQSTPPPAPPAAAPVAVGPDASPAEQYAAAQNTSGPLAASLYLAAALGWHRDGDALAAASALDAIDPGMLAAGDQANYWLLVAETAIDASDVDRAATALAEAAAAPNADPYRHAVLGARLCLVAGGDNQARFACAMERLTSAAPAAAQRQDHQDRIWALLGRAPAAEVQQHAQLATGTARGWWVLKAAMLSSFSVVDQSQALAAWRSAWPAHPAAQILPTALQTVETLAAQSRHVALLLPLSGPLGRAGRAVRDGFVAAYYHSRRHDTSQPVTITLLDATREPIPLLVERALVGGADIIVGPLAKSRVEELNAINPLVPVLTLNYLDDHIEAAPAVSQLGLAIEDEATSLVNQLLIDNVERLVVFHNYDDWSQRAARQIRDTWPYPLTLQPFADVRTITESVGQAMDVQASQARRDALAQTLGVDLEFLPRARQDVDGIVALVDTVEANALAPALQFHLSQAVPVYASSQTVRGAQPADLRELQGFRVSELPWFVDGGEFYEQMDQAFGIDGNPVSSLYALGIDAFRISDRLTLLQRGGGVQLLGSTGALDLQPDGRIRRTLARGVIKDAQLLPLATAPDH